MKLISGANAFLSAAMLCQASVAILVAQSAFGQGPVVDPPVSHWDQGGSVVWDGGSPQFMQPGAPHFVIESPQLHAARARSIQPDSGHPGTLHAGAHPVAAPAGHGKSPRFHGPKPPYPVELAGANRVSVWKQPYSYGHFGASHTRHWSLHHGHQRSYTQWTLR